MCFTSNLKNVQINMKNTLSQSLRSDWM
uniref:Uncharacterized protein n=1 Tax=Tetranychus urticae TaxID=32264 RepID=T1KEC0_TETUR